MRGLIFSLLVGIVPLFCTAKFSFAFGATEDVQTEVDNIRLMKVGVKVRSNRLLDENEVLDDGNHDPEATAAAAVAEGKCTQYLF